MNRTGRRADEQGVLFGPTNRLELVERVYFTVASPQTGHLR
jgi:hypothetical protein